jgi:hypothetical protein
LDNTFYPFGDTTLAFHLQIE